LGISGPGTWADTTLRRPPEGCGTLPHTGGSIAPGASVVSTITAPRALTAQQKADIKGGKRSIYIWGEVEFIDAFNKPRWVKFKGEHGAFSAANDTEPIICPDGNDAN